MTFVYSLLVAVVAVCAMVAFSPVPSVSSTAVRVTVWGVFQFALVNVRAFWTPGFPVSVSSTVTAVVSLLVMVTVTSWVGSADRRAV